MIKNHWLNVEVQMDWREWLEARHIPLTDEGRDLFSRLVVGRHAEQTLFSHDNGKPQVKIISPGDYKRHAGAPTSQRR